VGSISPSGSLSEPRSLMIFNQTYLLLTGKSLFDESYVTSPVKVARETLGKLESLLTESENVSEKDLASTAKFLRTCLAVNTANTSRATALEVLEGGWITSGCACQCGWCDF
jgi:hypothetical protein